MGFTADLAARATSLRLADVPVAARDAAKAALLDTLVVALAARTERVVAAVEGFTRDEGGAGPCTVWGATLRASPARAALVNGTAAHALDFDDVCWAMNAHPSAVLWPAALAAAEWSATSGERALLAYVAGFEAEADLGLVLGRDHYAMGFHPTATLGTVAAAVAAGSALGSSEASLRRAVGIACSEAAGSRMAFGTDTKPLHAGLAAQAGVTAALLAARGVTAREDGVEADLGLVALYGGGRGGGGGASGAGRASTGADAPGVLGPRLPRAGYALVSPGIETKLYPSCRFTHRVIDAVLALRGRRTTSDVAAIECVVDPFAPKIVVHARPATGLEAKFSMEYCAAVAWLDGTPGPAAFSDERAAAPDVQALLRRVTVRVGSPDAETVTIARPDGRVDSETVHVAKGSPARPLTPVERLDKARRCAGRALGDSLETLADQVERLETLTDVRELSRHLHVPG